MSKYNTKDIISVLTMSLIIANGNKDNMLHALEVAEQELDKLLAEERKNAYEHASIKRAEFINNTVYFLKTEGFDSAAKRLEFYAKEEGAID